MLSQVKSLSGCRLKALDGEIGSVKELYFDDLSWSVRYLVADSGNWLTGRMVLISPNAITDVSIHERSVSISLTKKQIEDSPPLETDKPVSRQFEQIYHAYYGWPQYWATSYTGNSGGLPYIMRGPVIDTGHNSEPQHSDMHLRSTNDVDGYHVKAADGEIGHISDFIVDNVTWEIRYVVIDTHNIWPGKHILISPHWVASISWDDSQVLVNVTRETIKLSPEYDRKSDITPEDEAALREYYEGYWQSSADSQVLRS
jgi:hypothetical protein